MYNDYANTKRTLDAGDKFVIVSNDINKYLSTLKWVTGCVDQALPVENGRYKLTLKA